MDRELIVKELQKSEFGYTIAELALKLHISRQTLATAFAYLEGANQVLVRQAGRAKIYYWKKGS